MVILGGLQWGLTQVTEGFLLEIIRTSKFKATLLSTQEQVRTGVTALTGLGVGFVFEHFSYQYGFIATSLLLVATLVPVYLYIARSR